MPEDFSAWWAIGSAATLPIVRLLFRVRVEGIEHVPASGSGILAFNHVSVLDGPALAIETARRRRREVRFLVAAEIFGHWFYGRVLRTSTRSRSAGARRTRTPSTRRWRRCARARWRRSPPRAG